MIYLDLTNKLDKLNKTNLYLASSVGLLEMALNIILKEEEEIQDMIEIGTYNGLSSAIFSYYSKRIFTFDICQRNADHVWNLLGVRNNINSFVSTQENIDVEINYFIRELMYKYDNTTNFNFAFVDGAHDKGHIQHDFELVKFCKRVLFHDYNIAPDVNAFCDEIGAKQVGTLPFAYWEEE
jgi:predicted O-methyltransferase YrrM